MTNIIIAGAKGRMGQALLRCAKAMPGVAITGQIDSGQDLGECIAGRRGD
jgi:dihydrodipicolinate reductase